MERISHHLELEARSWIWRTLLSATTLLAAWKSCLPAVLYDEAWMGIENFLKETNTGKGMKFPRQIAFYVKYILPLIVLFIFVMGYYTKFFA